MARNIRRRREALGLNQAELAELARAAGARWTQSKIAAIETGRRELRLAEALVVGNLLGIGLPELLLVDEPEVSLDGINIPTDSLDRMVRGEPVLTLAQPALDSANAYLAVLARGFRRRLRSLAKRYGIDDSAATLDQLELAAHGAAERAAATRQHVTPEEVAAAAHALWGRSLSNERRRRARRRQGGDAERELADALRTAHSQAK